MLKNGTEYTKKRNKRFVLKHGTATTDYDGIFNYLIIVLKYGTQGAKTEHVQSPFLTQSLFRVLVYFQTEQFEGFYLAC